MNSCQQMNVACSLIYLMNMREKREEGRGKNTGKRSSLGLALTPSLLLLLSSSACISDCSKFCPFAVLLTCRYYSYFYSFSYGMLFFGLLSDPAIWTDTATLSSLSFPLLPSLPSSSPYLSSTYSSHPVLPCPA
jgi:hypothetical protein